MGAFPGTYAQGFAPRDFAPRYPELWKGCVLAVAPGLGNTGSKLYDWAGQHDDFTLSNSPPWSEGLFGVNLSFNGGNQYGTLAKNISFNATDQWSVAVWLNEVSGSGRADYAGIQTQGRTQFQYTSGNALAWVTQDTELTVTGPSVSRNARHHVVTTYNNGTTIFFLDGVQSSSVSQSGTMTIKAIGNGYDTSISAGWKGMIDDFRVYNRVISPQEARLLATRQRIAYESERPPKAVQSGGGGGGSVFNPYYYHRLIASAA